MQFFFLNGKTETEDTLRLQSSWQHNNYRMLIPKGLPTEDFNLGYAFKAREMFAMNSLHVE